MPLTKVCLRRQSWAKYLEQIKEVKQNWARAEDFGNYFRVIFNRYYRSFISGRKTWCLALSPPNFDIVLIFPDFRQSIKLLGNS